jgi:hypothetical protein
LTEARQVLTRLRDDQQTVGVFFLFGCLTLVALAYFARKVPETKGRSLRQLEQDLTGRAVG